MRFRIPHWWSRGVRQFWQRRWRQWLDNRLPAQSVMLLQQRSIFIFFSGSGWLFFGTTILIAIAAFNYQNNMGLLLVFTLASLGLLTIFSSFKNLMHLRVRALPAPSVFAGSDAQFVVIMDAPAGRGEAIGIGLNRDIQQWVSSNADGQMQCVLRVPTSMRGVLTMPRFYLCSTFPFGWMRVWSWPLLSAQTLIYPAPLAPSFALRRVGGERNEGDTFDPGSEDFYAHRVYRPGDASKQIDWKVYARERGLLVREFVSPQGGEWLFRLQDLPHADREVQLSWLCYLLCEAEQSGQHYALDLGDGASAMSQGDQHLQHCLERLALA